MQAGLRVIGVRCIADLDGRDFGLQHVGRRQVLVQKGLDLTLRLRTHEAIGWLAVDHQAKHHKLTADKAERCWPLDGKRK